MLLYWNWRYRYEQPCPIFLAEGKTVGGYDRVQSPLTDALTKEGAFIHYEDNIDAVPQQFLDKERTLIVYTPAVPSNHSELNFSVRKVLW